MEFVLKGGSVSNVAMWVYTLCREPEVSLILPVVLPKSWGKRVFTVLSVPLPRQKVVNLPAKLPYP